MSPRLLGVTLALIAASAFSAEPAKDKSKPKGQKMEKLDLGLGNFTEIPKGTDLKKAEPKKEADSPTVMPSAAVYTVVKVVHGKSFTRSATGASPAAPFDAVPLSATMMTDKFSSVVRVKCPQKLNAGIQVAIIDARGDSIMSADGNLAFRGTKQEEVDWTVEWEPTPVRGPGEYKFQVQVNGEILGTFPLKMAESAPPPKK
jgi:hypothetical protein